MAHRRQLIAAIGGAGLASLAGCTDLLSETSVECSFTNVANGGACEVKVENNGFGGDKKVTLETRDTNGDIVGTRSKTVHVGFGESRRVNINPALHSDMDHVTASVERA